jgi:hypothetical protein
VVGLLRKASHPADPVGRSAESGDAIPGSARVMFHNRRLLKVSVRIHQVRRAERRASGAEVGFHPFGPWRSPALKECPGVADKPVTYRTSEFRD